MRTRRVSDELLKWSAAEDQRGPSAGFHEQVHCVVSGMIQHRQDGFDDARPNGEGAVTDRLTKQWHKNRLPGVVREKQRRDGLSRMTAQGVIAVGIGIARRIPPSCGISLQPFVRGRIGMFQGVVGQQVEIGVRE
jgi:hypothetical protein